VHLSYEQQACLLVPLGYRSHYCKLHQSNFLLEDWLSTTRDDILNYCLSPEYLSYREFALGPPPLVPDPPAPVVVPTGAGVAPASRALGSSTVPMVSLDPATTLAIVEDLDCYAPVVLVPSAGGSGPAGAGPPLLLMVMLSLSMLVVDAPAALLRIEDRLLSLRSHHLRSSRGGQQ
jgi:hypothetical protein